MKQVSKIILLLLIILTTSVSFVFAICHIVIRTQRNDWIITTAEITFVGTPDGVVFGTFTDYNGMVHTNQVMYIDDKFMPIGLIKGQPRNDPDQYIGKTVRIMYDPKTVNSGDNIKIGADIDSYDKWLQEFIVSGVAFGISAASLTVVCVFKFKKATGDSV